MIFSQAAESVAQLQIHIPKKLKNTLNYDYDRNAFVGGAIMGYNTH